MRRVPIRLELRVYERRQEPIIEDAWAKTQAILRALAADVREHGARLIVVAIPSRFEVDDASWRLTQALYGVDENAWDRRHVMARLADIAREEDIAFLDLSGPLRTSKERPYFTYDGHWTAAGHAIAARALLDAMRARGWLADCAS